MFVSMFPDLSESTRWLSIFPVRRSSLSRTASSLLRMIVSRSWASASLFCVSSNSAMCGPIAFASRMSRIGKQELNFGVYDSVEDTVARIDAVTTEGVYDLARSLFRPPGGVSVGAVVGPYAHQDDLPADLHEVIAS